MADFLWGNSGEPASAGNAAVTESGSLPPWYQEYLRGNINQANAAIPSEYTPYKDASGNMAQRIATFNPTQQQGFDLTTGSVGQYQPNIGNAVNQADASSNYNANTFQNNFFNPYANQAMDILAQKSNQNFNEQIMPGVMNTFTGGGQFGSARNGRFMDQAIRDQQQNLTQAQNNVFNQAWTGGQANYADWANRGITGANAAGNLSQLGQAMNLKDAAALETVGNQQQQQTQSNLDLAYQDWQNQQNWGKDQAAWLSNILHGTPGPSAQPSSVQTSFQPIQSSSPLAALAGGILQGTTATQTQVPQTTVQNKKKGGLIMMKECR